MGSLEYRLLSSQEVSEGLSSLSGWTVNNKELRKSFKFERYQEGLVFSTAVGLLADRLDHHPDIHIGYKQVDISVSTHATDGLSPYDLELARRIDSL